MRAMVFAVLLVGYLLVMALALSLVALDDETTWTDMPGDCVLRTDTVNTWPFRSEEHTSVYCLSR